GSAVAGDRDWPHDDEVPCLESRGIPVENLAGPRGMQLPVGLQVRRDDESSTRMRGEPGERSITRLDGRQAVRPEPAEQRFILGGVQHVKGTDNPGPVLLGPCGPYLAKRRVPPGEIGEADALGQVVRKKR